MGIDNVNRRIFVFVILLVGIHKTTTCCDYSFCITIAFHDQITFYSECPIRFKFEESWQFILDMFYQKVFKWLPPKKLFTWFIIKKSSNVWSPVKKRIPLLRINRVLVNVMKLNQELLAWLNEYTPSDVYFTADK